MKAGIFPGDGSEYEGMSRLIEGLPAATLDPGFDLRRITADVLSDRLRAEKAVYCVSTFLWDSFKGRKDWRLLAGHSLGYYAALYAAGAISREDGLRVIDRVYSAIREVAAGLHGGMSAIIGLKSSIIERFCAEIGGVFVANINSATQVVISGDIDSLAGAEARARREGALNVKRLPVDAPLHSPLMSGICGVIREMVKDIRFRPPVLPVVDHTRPRLLDDAEAMREVLCEQLSRKVLWRDTVEFIHAQGVGEFVEVGPSDVLSKLVRWVKRDASVITSEEFLRQGAVDVQA